MISWRYHLISIVAVFLALGLGLLMGTALLNDRLVENLRDRTEIAQERLNEREERLATLTSFAGQVLPFVAEDRLIGHDVVVVTYDGVDEGALADARRALELGGAQVQATLVLQEGMAAAAPAEQRALSEMLDVSEATPDGIAAAATAALAERLAVGPLPGPPEDDLLTKLLSEGFVVAVEPELDTTASIGGVDQALVFVAGSTVPNERPAETLMRLIDEIARRTTVLAVAEPTTSTAGVVGAIREDLEAVGALVTVDDIDSAPGIAALVLGLERAIESGEGGDYGIGEGAQLLPAAA